MKRLIPSLGQKPGGSVLVLYYHPPHEPMRPAIESHLRVLTNSDAAHQVLYLNVVEGVPSFVGLLPFDVVILHTTLLCSRWAWFFEAMAAEVAWLRRSNAVIIALPQDEYDHSAILDEWMESMGVQVIGSNFDESVRPLLYPRMHNKARFFKCLTGYIDPAHVAEYAGKMPPIKDRPVDIVYRAAHLPFWFGSQGQLKHRIADVVGRRAGELGYRVDISTDHAKTIAGKQWFDFLGSSKTVIGCESGSSVLDPRGLIQKRIRELLAQTPTPAFEDLHRFLSPDWDSHRFFAIGPRHLEAIITRTCQILVEGDYDGVLLPHRHYLPLKRDFSNLDEILAMIKDFALLEATANRAYEDILQSGKYSYRSFAKQIETAFPNEQHPRSSFYWWVVCSLISLHIGTTAWLAPPASLVARSCRRIARAVKKAALWGLGFVRGRQKVPE